MDKKKKYWVWGGVGLVILICCISIMSLIMEKDNENKYKLNFIKVFFKNMLKPNKNEFDTNLISPEFIKNGNFQSLPKENKIKALEDYSTKNKKNIYSKFANLSTEVILNNLNELYEKNNQVEWEGFKYSFTLTSIYFQYLNLFRQQQADIKLYQEAILNEKNNARFRFDLIKNIGNSNISNNELKSTLLQLCNNSNDNLVKRAAVEIIQTSTLNGFYPELIDAYEKAEINNYQDEGYHKYIEYKAQLLKALGKRNEYGATDWIINLYSREKPELKGVILHSLELMGDKKAIPFIISIIDKSENNEEKMSAILSLGNPKFKDINTVNKLQKLMSNSNDENWGIKRAAIETLIKYNELEKIDEIVSKGDDVELFWDIIDGLRNNRTVEGDRILEKIISDNRDTPFSKKLKKNQQIRDLIIKDLNNR